MVMMPRVSKDCIGALHKTPAVRLSTVCLVPITISNRSGRKTSRSFSTCLSLQQLRQSWVGMFFQAPNLSATENPSCPQVTNLPANCWMTCQRLPTRYLPLFSMTMMRKKRKLWITPKSRPVPSLQKISLPPHLSTTRIALMQWNKQLLTRVPTPKIPKQLQHSKQLRKSKQILPPLPVRSKNQN